MLDVQRKTSYCTFAIRTFSCRKAERLSNREIVKEFVNIALEALQSDREGQHSIRINDRYRVCFTWKDASLHDLEITKHYC